MSTIGKLREVKNTKEHVDDLPLHQIPELHKALQVIFSMGFEGVMNMNLIMEATASRLMREGGAEVLDESKEANGGGKDVKENGTQTEEVEELEKETQTEEVGPPPPPGMILPADVTEDLRKHQWKDPQKWSMTLEIWEEVLAHAIRTETYKALKAKKRMVSMHDLNEHFVKPWTKGSGCGLALLMSGGEPKGASLMLSHTWSEDVEECLKAVCDKAEELQIPKAEARVWFCVFANYQCEDTMGPSIPDQLKLDPFKKVIDSEDVKRHGMFAVHTTQEDLYSRLWCVYEIAAAMQVENLRVESAMSKGYSKRATRRFKVFFDQNLDHKVCLAGAGVSCETAKALCGREDDEKMLIENIIKDHGTFSKLDKVIQDFRLATLPIEVAKMLQAAMFKSEHGGRFQDAAKYLGAHSNSRKISTELTCLLDKESPVDWRLAALDKLVLLTDKGDDLAISVLLQCCDSFWETEIRARAVTAVQNHAEKGDAAAISVVQQCLTRDTDPDVRERAAQALVTLMETGTESVIAALVHCAQNDCAASARRSAAKALTILAGSFDAAVINALLSVLEASSFDSDLREEMLTAIRAKGAVVEATICMIHGLERHKIDILGIMDLSSFDRRMTMLTKLAGRTDQTLISAALGRIDDGDWAVRTAAVLTLGAVAPRHDEQVIAALIGRLGGPKGPDGSRSPPGDADRRVRGAAVLALDSLGLDTPDAVFAMAAASDDAEGAVWMLAGNVLRTLRPGEFPSVEALLGTRYFLPLTRCREVGERGERP